MFTWGGGGGSGVVVRHILHRIEEKCPITI